MNFGEYWLVFCILIGLPLVLVFVTDSEPEPESPISEFSDFVRSHPAQVRVGVGVTIVGEAIIIVTGGARPVATTYSNNMDRLA